MLKFGLIGIGRMGQIHAQSIMKNKHAQLSMIAASKNTTRAEQLAQTTGAELTSAHHLLQCSELDAVVIASSTDTHAEYAKMALESGKAVFCEKPLDLALDNACMIAQISRTLGIPLFVGFNRRFDPHILELKKQIDNGKIGKLEQLTIVSRDPAPPTLDYLRNSGGLFCDMTVHDFDIARFFLDDEPCSITAQGSVLVDPAIAAINDIDTAMVMLSNSKNQQVVIINSRRSVYGYDQRIEAFGSHGLMSTGNQQQTTVQGFDGSGPQGSLPEYFFTERYAKAFEAELMAFTDALHTGMPMPVTGYDGVAALYLAQRATAAMASKKTELFDMKTELEHIL